MLITKLINSVLSFSIFTPKQTNITEKIRELWLRGPQQISAIKCQPDT